jgi:hypothetical protein
VLQRERPRTLFKIKLRRCDHVGLREAFRDANAEGRPLILIVTAGGQPYIKCEHLRIDGATFKIVDCKKGVYLVWVFKDGHPGKWLGLAANAKAGCKEGWPRTPKRFGRGPFNE